jgi:putative ABC transport system permease protein
MKRNLLIIKLAIDGILTNKLRSFLTVLGIIIGIASVIALLSLGEGAQAQVAESISSLGTNVINIIPGSSFISAAASLNSNQLTDRDIDFINNSARFPNIDQISPLSTGIIEVKKDDEKINSSVLGSDVSYAEMIDLGIQTGSFFKKSHIDAQQNVAVIGPDVADKLFDGESFDQILDQKIRVQDQSFTIIGILESRGGSSFSNDDEDIFIPYTTANNKVYKRKSYNVVAVSVKDPELISSTSLRITEKLSDFRGFDVEDKDFSLITSDDILQTASQITGIFTTLLSSIAGISLLVGGIGISNIMLVSVTERTKEIGLRKAIGARESDILLQFLVEAVALTLFGGLMGILSGLGMAGLIGSLADMPAKISAESIILATSISVIVGVIFGYYPAYRAAKLDPIEALRYE